MKVLICGAHPDDPESGCGGLAANYARAGHQVVLVYFSCGVRGVEFQGRPHTIVRAEEARAAAKVLGAEAHFIGFEDTNVCVTTESTTQVAGYLGKAQPDIVLTHWPIDTHPDHQTTGALVLRAYLGQDRWPLYFYEVMTGVQSLCFQPTGYVDITAVEDLKRQACFCHESQGIGSWYEHHEQMNRWRGHEAGVAAAEAFIYCPRGFSLPKLLAYRDSV